MDRNDVMSTVHRRFATAAPELPNGFAEHTTMGAEAMLAVGLDPSAVLTWADRHDAVAVPDRSALLITRTAITEELAVGDWRLVLRQHVAALVGRLDAHAAFLDAAAAMMKQ